MRYDPDFANPIFAKVEGPAADGPLSRLWFWACVLNSIVPFLLGTAVTSGLARGGMVLGIVAVVWFGWSLAGTFPEVVRTVVYGGWVVALAQLFPVFQVIAGVIAVSAVTQLGLGIGEGQGSRVDGLAGGFLATIVTGGLLIALAGVLGGIGRVVAYLARGVRGGETGRGIEPTPKEA